MSIPAGYREAKRGEKAEVGDKVQRENNFYGKTHLTVKRVTEHFCFIPWNEVSEGKLPRVYTSWGLWKTIPKVKWDTNTYTLLKKL
jgi:hypothetical protein